MMSELVNTELTTVCDMITARMGLEFLKGRFDVLSRSLTLAAVGFGFSNLNEFTKWLLKTELNNTQVKKLASYITITETYFWRETDVYNALIDKIIPEIIASKKDGERNIRIWSAGCSTGEEPYSLAIALHKAVPNIEDWNIHILATDINPVALDKAISGIYGKWSFRSCPRYIKNRYFKSLGEDLYQIAPEIKEMVTFASLNLTDDVYPSIINDTNSMDIIFCRNVLMYFSEKWVSKISNNFYNSLSTNGWFVVSSCELSSQIFPQFNSVNFENAILYQKKNKIQLSVENKPIYKTERFPLVANQKVIDISGTNNPVIEMSRTNKTSFDLIPKKNPEIIEVLVSESKIRILADQGFLDEALLLCNKRIKIDKLSIGLYSLRASILQELDRRIEAIASLKQAIYLDPNFVMGHFVLGNLYLSQNKLKSANLYFNNVLNLLNPLESDEIIQGSDGLSVKHIKEMTIDNLQKLK